MAEYTFYPKFQEFVALYRGVVRVWIGDGVTTGEAGMLFAEYIDGAVQQLGMVSDYNEAKAYFAELGIDLSYRDWVELLTNVPTNARLAQVSAEASEESNQQSEAWAVGQRQGTDVPSTDPTYHNNAKYYSDNAGTQADNAASSAAAALSSESAAQTAQGLAEAAQAAAETAQGLAETAQGAAETAQGLAETAQTAAETAQGAAETAQRLAETAQGLAEDAQSAAEDAQGLAETAQASAEAAESGAEDAQQAAETAQGLAEAAQAAAETAQGHAEDEADDAEAWANGKRNGTDVPSTDPAYHNNAKYYSEFSDQRATDAYNSELSAATSEHNAALSESGAAASEENAEAWAVGERNSVPVSIGDNTYQNNSKYYAQQAGTSAANAAASEANAATSEANASDSADLAEELAQSIKSATSETFYQNSDSGTSPPVGRWYSAPDPQTGQFMWMKTVLTWTDQSTSEIYGVSYIGANGTGSVRSVNAKGGDVVLYGSDISMNNQDASKLDAEITALKNIVVGVATQADIDSLFV